MITILTCIIFVRRDILLGNCEFGLSFKPSQERNPYFYYLMYKEIVLDLRVFALRHVL